MYKNFVLTSVKDVAVHVCTYNIMRYSCFFEQTVMDNICSDVVLMEDPYCPINIGLVIVLCYFQLQLYMAILLHAFTLFTLLIHDLCLSLSSGANNIIAIGSSTTGGQSDCSVGLLHDCT